MSPLLFEVALAGIVIGIGFGLFGAGASAVATPVLVLLGVPALAAIASPLPAAIPAALAGAWRHRRDGDLDIPLARLVAAVGVPSAVAGALASQFVGGRPLLVLSGAMLLVIGARLLWPSRSEGHRLHPAIVGPGAAVIGVLTGLLANSGGFLLVPFFLTVVGLSMRRAAGTSLVVAAALSVPTMAAHWAVGDIAWPVAAAFALGLVPAAAAGAAWGTRLDQRRVQRVFAVGLVGFAAWFTLAIA